jgi:thiol:disulfide interchange protein DsbC
MIRVFTSPTAAVGGLFLAASACTALAQPSAKDVEVDAFAARLKVLYPATRFDMVTRATVPNLYEVTMGKNVAYVEPSGRYFLFGHVWDMQARKDLTADRKTALDKVDPSALPKELAIRSVRGSGRRVLYVMADPQCGYCRQLERALAEVDDVSVYTFVLPILGLESRRLAADVWCAPDREAAWRDWMLRSVAPPAARPGCDTPFAAIERLAESMGIAATPALVAMDGRKYAGALPAAELNAWLGPAGATSSARDAVVSTVKTPAR